MVVLSKGHANQPQIPQEPVWYACVTLSYNTRRSFRRYDMRHEMLTQRALFCHRANTKRGSLSQYFVKYGRMFIPRARWAQD